MGPDPKIEAREPIGLAHGLTKGPHHWTHKALGTAVGTEDTISLQRVIVPPTRLNITCCCCTDLSNLKQGNPKKNLVGNSATTLDGLINYVGHGRPEVLLMENVKALAKGGVQQSDEDEQLQLRKNQPRIEEELARIDYSISFTVLGPIGGPPVAAANIRSGI